MDIKATVKQGKIKLLEDVVLPEDAELLITIYSEKSSKKNLKDRLAS